MEEKKWKDEKDGGWVLMDIVYVRRHVLEWHTDSHSQSCLLLIWNCISTCSQIQTISWHKIPLKHTPTFLTSPLPPLQPLFPLTTSPNQAAPANIALSSTFSWKFQFSNFCIPIYTPWRIPSLFRLGVTLIFLYLFHLIHLSGFVMEAFNCT